MIDITTMLEMLRSSDLKTEEGAIARGKYFLAGTIKETIKQYKKLK